MTNFKKFSILFLLFEIIIIFISNIFYFQYVANSSEKIYQVDINRLVKQLEKDPNSTKDLTEFPSVLKVSSYDSSQSYNNHYAVKKINNKLYAIEYRIRDRYFEIIPLNIGFLVLFFLSVFLLSYLWQKLIRPFNRMSDMTHQLAKGYLVKPLDAEKSKFLGKFLWGLDMLRENLADEKHKALNLEKDKKTLILSLTHDIKTPLSAIELYTRALQSGLYKSPEKNEEALKGISKNIKKITTYVDEISLASKEDFLNIVVKDGEYYLASLLQEVKSYYEPKLKNLKIDFKVDDTDNCLLLGDLDRTIEVIQNGVENAIKYGDGKEIIISVSEEENCKLISIQNTGYFCKEEELPHIFDSFYRGSNSKSVKGSGLGLYIAKTIMRKMHGDIFVEIKNNKFCLTLVIQKV
ncbi:sensor histidine kinase [Streptococcus parauberis]|uniref:sensor histidine kinase n=1 Tax=Streptococcus parauberis TaxID=1348 RepID=UPI00378AFBF9